MAMSTAYLNGIANAGASLVQYIGLVDDNGDELSGGSYARQAVTWDTATNGVIRPASDLTFNVPAGKTVAGWRGYSAASSGTDYGGAALDPQPFVTAGTYTLLAAQTGIEHDTA